ncbi:phosphoenolpyruvate carboxykinase (ATP) [bacterium AH-315-C07]|nr:phosphoenolpyruvate carboxykinase (ATP) [bacterium AH-315-C07]
MEEVGIKSKNANLEQLGLGNVEKAYWNLTPEELTAKTIEKGQGSLSSTGALAVDTGEFTGRSPKDRFVVEDDVTRDTVWWGDINIKFDEQKFDQLYNKVTDYLANKEVFVRDAYVCADENYKMNLRIVNEYPWSNMFAYNMFLRPTKEQIADFIPEWNIISAPGFRADPSVDGTRQHNFAILNFSKKLLLIGGTGYTGEIKKGVFSVLNFILPYDKNVLAMHCSANTGKDGDTAVFFGLSGTGKTTLSSDPDRELIGDDEHGWADSSVFNFEGGCYAKCIDLSREKEPQIFDAIKSGAILENINFKEGTTEVDYHNCSKTENTRVSYPIYHIENTAEPSVGTDPKNIFFLTCDAYGVLPPISKLTPGQAMYHFISGYTAKVAGTEEGVTEPQTAFSACFGAPFLPLHPTKYAEMLGEKMTKHDVKVWLINTGWSGGVYGVGERISLKYTRAMITAALNGELDNVEYVAHRVFGLQMPTRCPNVSEKILSPRNTWTDKDAYDRKAATLAAAFNKNFEKYSEFANEDILAGAPKVEDEVTAA